MIAKPRNGNIENWIAFLIIFSSLILEMNQSNKMCLTGTKALYTHRFEGV
jgi:hypothetical protein